MTGQKMEPMLPGGVSDALEEQALKLTSVANRISASLPPDALRGVGGLVRSMNCYYSNLIEVQRMIDMGEDPNVAPTSADYIR
ncbi:MAG: hypothetical protein GY770_18830 [Aestuariibacter sp.]|nr:hypothetical protein [Aestuariibacter sp.]